MIFQKNQRFFKLPKLHAPTLTANGTIVTVTNPETNGKFADGWELYEEGQNAPVVTMKFAEGLTYDLFYDVFSFGEHKIYAKAIGENCTRSDSSNIVTITI